MLLADTHLERTWFDILNQPGLPLVLGFPWLCRHNPHIDWETGIILSQRAVTGQKLHPCAFSSQRLSPAEQNYDIRNHELLAGKLALEEWRHCLEGAKLPFLVWTDHKNLEYISSAKRLNSRQHGGHYFLPTLIFLSPIAPDPGTASRTPCPGSFWWMGTKWEALNPSFLHSVWLPP